MLRIAVVDDEFPQLKIYEEYINKLSDIYSELEYDTFYSGEELLKDYLFTGNAYDIILLDIEMEGSNGIQTANELRKIDKKTVIIFITKREEYVFDGYEPDAFRYLMKPVSFTKFADVFNLAYQKIQAYSKPFCFSVGAKRIRVYCDDVIYCESYKREVVMYTTLRPEPYRFYSKLPDIEDKLLKYDFIYVHKSFLVNMEYIDEINDKTLKVKNGNVIPISQRNRRKVRDEHYKYVERNRQL